MVNITSSENVTLIFIKKSSCQGISIHVKCRHSSWGPDCTYHESGGVPVIVVVKCYCFYHKGGYVCEPGTLFLLWVQRENFKWSRYLSHNCFHSKYDVSYNSSIFASAITGISFACIFSIHCL